jgi:TonB-dependent SusC/RagA subfamily outer membrane receptor
VSLNSIIHKNKKEKDGHFTHVQTTKNTSPFSFFNWIVYNPKNFSETELKQIITHEKVHASQKHSIDILLTQLSCIVLWFNPFIWLYNKDLKQNLEFMADRETQRQFNCKKSYQTTLLKTSMPSHQMALTNNFYTSLIKKRIVMLHKSKSKKINLIKYAFVIPLLAGFLMSFSTEEIYVEKENQDIFKASNEDKIDTFLIKNTFTDNQLQTFKNNLKSKGFNFNLKSIKRNSDKLITSIDFIVTKNDVEGKYRIGSPKPLNTLVIEYHNSDNKFIINTSDFIQSKKTINEDADVIKITIDKNTTANSLEEQKKNLKEKYNVDIDFKVLEHNDKGETKTYTFNIAIGKQSQKITSQSDQPHVFIYNPKTSLLTSYVINKNGDPQYGNTNYLEAQSSFIITKDYGDESIEKISEKLKEKGVKAKFTDIKRNDEGKIISITISAKSKDGETANYNQNSDEPINPVSITFYGNGNGVKISPSSISYHFKRKNKSSNQKNNDTLNNGWKTEFKVGKPFDSDSTIIKLRKFNIGSNATNTINDTVYFSKSKSISYSHSLKNPNANHISLDITDDEKERFSRNQIIAHSTLDGKTPLYVIDGEVITKEQFQELNPNNIASIAILKDAAAKSVYGAKGKDGVIMITTKREYKIEMNNGGVINKAATNTSKNGSLTSYDGNAILKIKDNGILVFIDGEEKTLKDAESLDPENVETMTVLKGKEATKIYGEKGQNDVLEITTKK